MISSIVDQYPDTGKPKNDVADCSQKRASSPDSATMSNAPFYLRNRTRILGCYRRQGQAQGFLALSRSTKEWAWVSLLPIAGVGIIDPYDQKDIPFPASTPSSS